MRILIGGISGGIGEAVAERLLQEGCVVGGVGRQSSRWEAFGKGHPNLSLHEADFTRPDEVKAAVETFVEREGGLDGYVHAIGSIFLKPLHLTQDSEWSAVLSTNLTSAFYACREVLKPMRRNKAGSIVLFSSVAARTGLGNHEAIAAAKGGIEAMVRSAAATNAPLGVRINAVAPGLVETPAASAMTANESVRQLSERMHPLGRLGQPSEVASLVSWLLSEDAEWMTGEVISLDGGMGSILPKPRG